MGCTIVIQIKGASSNLAHRSIYQKHIGYFTNGYFPIYFTNKALIFLKWLPNRATFFITNVNEMIYLKTPITKLGREPAVRIANMVLRWCRTNMGINKRKKFDPIWSIVKGYDNDCGAYDADDNEVWIYWDQCSDVRELINTCVHEWTHQLQPIRTKYYKYPGSYSRNPYERQARRNEDKYTPIVWKQIKHKINKKYKDGLRN